MAISSALADIYNANPSGFYYAEVLTIKHSALAQPLVLTNTTVEFELTTDYGVHTAIPTPFTLTLPTKDTSGSQAMNVVISNREQSILDDVEWMARQPYEPAILTYNVVIKGVVDSSGVHEPQYTPSARYDVTTFTVTEDSIVAMASRVNTHNKRWPKVIYTPDLFPGLDR